MQVLLGDVPSAVATQQAFFSIWQRYGALPERYILGQNDIHSSERYYPLRPEFVESTYFLYQATHDDTYLWMGEFVYQSLHNHTRVPHGYASIQNVANKQVYHYHCSSLLPRLHGFIHNVI
jgi:mannosidase alpha-like ER degradation enhancer 1